MGVVLTDKIINQGRSSIGGWSRAQLAVLGVDWPPSKGWKKKLIGTVVSAKAIKEFLRLKKAEV